MTIRALLPLSISTFDLVLNKPFKYSLCPTRRSSYMQRLNEIILCNITLHKILNLLTHANPYPLFQSNLHNFNRLSDRFLLCDDNVNNKTKIQSSSFIIYHWSFSKIAKLKEEHRYLQKSCEEIVTLNQRLQTVGLCTHAIHQKDKAKIKDLEGMLASMTVRNAGSAEESLSYDAHPKIGKSSPPWRTTGQDLINKYTDVLQD